MDRSFKKFNQENWIVRIEEMGVFLKDASNKIISNENEYNGFYVNIGYPVIFHNVDFYNETRAFRAPKRFCESQYYGTCTPTVLILAFLLNRDCCKKNTKIFLLAMGILFRIEACYVLHFFGPELPFSKW